jgi:BirA family biotin operon repressor/biotin-[acetyl-CoA-carboxylase] ligase
MNKPDSFHSIALSRRFVGEEDLWRISHHACVCSTQDLAREMSPWSAVWADEQTGGRGQAERVFVSDLGGLYLTAVLPYAGDALAARGFALAVGWAACTALRRVGVKQIRLRWPNDLLVGSAKVGGILVEQGGANTLLVGLGLNITNRPWVVDPSLVGLAGRLVDSVESHPLPERAELVAQLLRAIRLAHRTFGRRQLVGLPKMLERCWGTVPRRVLIEPAGGVTLPVVSGLFLGIDTQGAVRLGTGANQETRVPAYHIHRLREVD